MRTPARTADTRPVSIDGLSAATVRELRDRPGPDPADVARALTRWRRTVHGPARSLARSLDSNDCPCCDDLAYRDVLERALATLGPRASRELRARVAPLDDVFESRTWPDPQNSADLPWWRRRA